MSPPEFLRRPAKTADGSTAPASPHAAAGDAMAEATAALAKTAATVGVDPTGAFSRCGLDKPPGFPLNDAMVKIAGAKSTNDSSARQRRGRTPTSLAASMDRLWKEFKILGDEIEAAAAAGRPVAALLRKQEKLRARSWALADRGESVRLALAERSVGGARRRGNKPKAVASDF